MRRRGECSRASGRAWCRSDVRAAQQQSSLLLRTHPRGAGRTGRTARCGGRATVESSRDFLTPQPLIRLGGGLCLTYQQDTNGRAKDGRARHFKNVTTRPRTATLAHGVSGRDPRAAFPLPVAALFFRQPVPRSPRTAVSSGRRVPESAPIAGQRTVPLDSVSNGYHRIAEVCRLWAVRLATSATALVPSPRFPPPCQRC